ncbi:hypothetical protein [Pseudonocardia pini]|uniref:hypothetical protein n=1 Tax=Pseudonocardia pini TaxID=2758030 RepID=UPI0015F0D128|nr:hypothetical protein [Pseudonocardia pini]
MTTATASDVLATTPARRRRYLASARIHLVNLPLSLGMPWLILGSSFVVNLIIYSMLPENPNDPRTTGGIMSIYIFALIAHVVSMTQSFPFALGLSVTRRDFFAGLSLIIVVESAVQGLVLTGLRAIELASAGWGIDMTFFGVPFLVQDNWFLQWVLYSVPFLALSYLAVLFGTIYKRFGQPGMWVSIIGLVLVGGAAAILLTWSESWGVVARFFTETAPLTLIAGYPVILAVLFAGLAWLLLRRATP